MTRERVEEAWQKFNLALDEGAGRGTERERFVAVVEELLRARSGEWERLVDTRPHMVRRLPVPGGWLYQTQTGLRYSTAPGTIGRERDEGTPEWGPSAFVPESVAEGICSWLEQVIDDFPRDTHGQEVVRVIIRHIREGSWRNG